MESFKEINISVYEFLGRKFKPIYEACDLDDEDDEKLAFENLENLTLNVFTPKKENEIDPQGIKKSVLVPYEMGRRFQLEDLADELEEEYKSRNMAFDELNEKIANTGKIMDHYNGVFDNVRKNIMNSNIEVYSIKEAKDMVEHAKVSQSVRGGEPKMSYINKVNNHLREIYQNHDTKFK